MNRLLVQALCGVALLLTLGCGEAPQPLSADPEPVQQHFRFTAIGEPAAGRFQIVATPQAALGVITQDQNGDPLTASSGTAQVYGANVRFAAGGVGYPTGCLTSSPKVMFANVDVLTGFTEQLRNVYVRITSVSGGQTFCGPKAAVGTFGASLNPNVHLYGYGPLDFGTQTFSRSLRTLTWGIQLPDDTTFWFDGELWAEVIPAAPTISSPANGATLRGSRTATAVAFAWKEDKAADGKTPTAGQAPKPQGVGAEITIWRCNASSAAYDESACTTVVAGPTFTAAKAYATTLPTFFWYRWTVRSAFTLPGSTARTIGSQATTRYFRTTFP